MQNRFRATTQDMVDAHDWALDNCPFDYDPDGGVRSRAQWLRDVFYGFLAERIARRMFEREGCTVRHIPDSENEHIDLIVAMENGIILNVEVKFRKLWNRSEPDMIVNHVHDDADIYVMVEMNHNRVSGDIHLWCTREDFEKHSVPFNFGNTAKGKRMVDRQYMTDISTLFERF
jgi:Holliday junction resolvase